MTIDLGVAYGAARERITALVTGANVDFNMRVPATPEWTVHDVVAHLSGIAADASSGNMEGAPGEAWTAAQVLRGAGRTVAELLADWQQNAPMIEGFLSSPAGNSVGNAVIDIHTHEADLRHALGLPVSLPADFLEWAGSQLRDGFHEQCSSAGLPTVVVIATDYEWFRARLGRRTVAEIDAYEWSADSAPYHDFFFVFGRATTTLGEPTLDEAATGEASLGDHT